MLWKVNGDCGVVTCLFSDAISENESFRHDCKSVRDSMKRRTSRDVTGMATERAMPEAGATADVSPAPTPAPSRLSLSRRERYLQSVVWHIEQGQAGRLPRAHSASHHPGKPLSEDDCQSQDWHGDPPTSLSGEHCRNRKERVGAEEGRSLCHKKGASTSTCPPPHWGTYPGFCGLGKGRDGRWAKTRNGTDWCRKPPRITVRSPSLEALNPHPDLYPLRGPLSQGGHPSSGFRPRPPSPMVTSTDGSGGGLFSWRVCTPTNWKRGKTQREVLLEKRMLRRKGRQPSQSKFISVFKLKDPRKLSAADRIRRVLRRAHFYGDDITRLPLVRFRRAVRTLIALLKTVKLSRDKGKGTEPSTWIDEDDIRASRKAYEMFGVSFDVYSFRARREIQVTNEARAVLGMAQDARSEDQRHVALVSLSQAVPEFGEFPIAMQEALVRVGWYENFEARRIIIREGHMADNFYLILSGSAVVTIREQNGAGEYFGRTVAVLQRGNSFGELALIYGGTRTATVTCKDNVELLAVGRDDYIDIFMHKTRDGGDPEHLRFLKQITVFCGWPINALPLDDPSIFLYTYVRRGMVLCKDSRESEWIYVIKSGSCRVLTALRAVTPSLPGPHDRHHPGPCRSREGEGRHSAHAPTARLCPLRPQEVRQREVWVPTPTTLTTARKLPAITCRTDSEVHESAVKHQKELEEIWRKRKVGQPSIVSEVSQNKNDESRDSSDQSKQKMKSDRIFVNLQTLQAKDVYGLEPVVLSVFKEPTRTSLVSDGAECIMISKKFFQQKLTEDVAKKIRKEIRPLPSEEVLQDKLQTQTDWDTFRAITVADFVDFRRQLNSLHDSAL